MNEEIIDANVPKPKVKRGPRLSSEELKKRQYERNLQWIKNNTVKFNQCCLQSYYNNREACLAKDKARYRYKAQCKILRSIEI